MTKSDDLTRNVNEDDKEIEEIDLYSDVLTDQDEIIHKLKHEVVVLTQEKKNLITNLNSLQQSYKQLKKDYDTLQSRYKNVSFNSSALFKTAQAELGRKNRTIQELRKDYDDLVFRKGPPNQSGHRKHDRSSRKISSKEIKAETVVVIEDDDSHLQEERRHQQQVLEDKSVEHNSTEVKEPSKSSMKSFSCDINNSKTNTPPPIQGPITAYSKRLYKKLYGVSPEKTQVPPTEQNVVVDLTGASSKLDETTVSPGLNRSGRKLDATENSSTKHESKPNSVTSKLQSEVKEFIKLGSSVSNKTSPPNKTLPFGTSKQQVNVSNREQVKPNDLKPESVTSSKVVIKCDLRESKNALTSSKSLNSVPINETIDSILKNHRAGKYDDNTIANKHPRLDKKIDSDQSTLASGSCKAKSNIKNDSDIKNTTLIQEENKPLISLENVDEKQTTPTNKRRRLANKPVISPATFGKLVPIDINKSGTKMSTKPDIKEIKPTKTVTASSTCRRASLFSPIKEASEIQRTKNSSNRKSTCFELFGESPIKSHADTSHLKNVSLDKPKSALNSTEGFILSSSPIFPSSPSLDSDNPEDLVIDTTACSQNTSPRGSQNYLKDEDENAIEISVPKKPDFGMAQPAKQMYPTPMENVKSSMPMEGNESTIVNNTTKLDKISNVLTSEELPQDKKKQDPTPENLVEEENPRLPDLSECFSLDNNEHAPFKIAPHDEVNKPYSFLDPQMLSKCELPSKMPKTFEDNVEKSTKTVNGNEETSENKYEDNKNEDIPETPKFIPSPPQLTLVSAFRHSENSVFNITEDTLGFVSALTRIRDISPIKTPVKHNKIFDISKNQSYNSAVEIENTLKPGTVGISALTCGANNFVKASVLESEHTNSSNMIFNGEMNQSKEEKASVSKIESNINSNKFEGTNKSVNNEIKVSANPQTNEFKRSRPVRRIIVQAANKSNTLAQPDKENINTKVSEPSSGDHKDVSKPEIDDTNKKSGNITSSVPNSPKLDSVAKTNGVVKCIQKQIPDKEVKDSTSSILDTNSYKTAINSTNPEKVIKEKTKKNIHKTAINSPYPEKDIQENNKKNIPINNQSILETISSTKVINSNNNSNVDNSKNVFKRSESLKMMPKPIAKINYDILNKRTEIEERIISTKIITNKDVIENQELAQLAHIASINKKIRVSKYQSSSREVIKSDLHIEHKNVKQPLGLKDIRERKHTLSRNTKRNKNNSEMNSSDYEKKILESKILKQKDKSNDVLKGPVDKTEMQSEAPKLSVSSKSCTAKTKKSGIPLENTHTKPPRNSPMSPCRSRSKSPLESNHCTQPVISKTKSPEPREYTHTSSTRSRQRPETLPQKRRSQSPSPEHHRVKSNDISRRPRRESPESPCRSKSPVETYHTKQPAISKRKSPEPREYTHTSRIRSVQRPETFSQHETLPQKGRSQSPSPEHHRVQSNDVSRRPRRESPESPCRPRSKSPVENNHTKQPAISKRKSPEPREYTHTSRIRSTQRPDTFSQHETLPQKRRSQSPNPEHHRVKSNDISRGPRRESPESPCRPSSKSPVETYHTKQPVISKRKSPEPREYTHTSRIRSSQIPETLPQKRRSQSPSPVHHRVKSNDISRRPRRESPESPCRPRSKSPVENYHTKQPPISKRKSPEPREYTHTSRIRSTQRPETFPQHETLPQKRRSQSPSPEHHRVQSNDISRRRRRESPESPCRPRSKTPVEYYHTKQPVISKRKSPEPREYTHTSRTRSRQRLETYSQYETPPQKRRSQSPSPEHHRVRSNDISRRPRRDSPGSPTRFPCRTRGRSPHRRYQNNRLDSKTHISRIKSILKPGTFSQTETTPHKRRSQSLSPERHRVYSSEISRRLRRENPSYHRSRSRSRSRSPRQRSKSAQWRKRSRSVSPQSWNKSRNRPANHERYNRRRNKSCHDHRRSRSCSPNQYGKRKRRSQSPVSRPDFYQKYNSNKKSKMEREHEITHEKEVFDEENCAQSNQFYIGQVEKLQRELESVKSNISNNDLQAHKDSNDDSNDKLVSNTQTSVIKHPVQSVVPKSTKDTVSIKYKLIPIELKDVTSSLNKKNTLNDNVPSQVDKSKYGLAANCDKAISVNSTPEADEPLKIIKISRRRTRQLGDSDVNVVSSSSKTNSTRHSHKDVNPSNPANIIGGVQEES